MLTFRLLVVLCVLGLLELAAAHVPPQCAMICAAQASQEPPYVNKTQLELCADKGYSQLVGGCVKQECTVIEGLSCGLPRVDHRRDVRVITLTMFALATVFFAIRMAVKYLRYTPWGADDTWLTLAIALLIPFVTVIQCMIPQGLGLEIWVLHDYQITTFLRYLLAAQTHYILTIAIIKASILAFFLRIFPDEMFKKVVWCTLIYDLLVGVIFFTLSLIQRQPTWLIWEGWKDKDQRGVVLELNNLGLGHGGMNIVLDLWMLVLPFTQLYKLQHPWHKKLGIFAMFSVGIFLTIVSAIRVKSLVSFATSENVTDDARETVIWSCIELCVGIVVACMPHARQLFREATRKFRRTRQPPSSAERTSRTYWSPRRVHRDDSVESGTAVDHSAAGPVPPNKSWYSSTTQSAYTTTTCTSSRQHSSFASDAPTRVASVAQTLDEAPGMQLKTLGDKPGSQG
ncbi:hypothetical protein N8I77_004750 [Diaporthe amygdali]|uniref:Rhodopsin domain-containing protein n=1 Tax=Phomopsis amygdali TaxID=1214568 RepID=A0AAD9W8Y1_PHOAM|nr:hypothetical protein N8I77_004750 [Diaporthe amygdali]